MAIAAMAIAAMAIAAMAIKIFVFTGDIEIATVVAAPIPIARSFCVARPYAVEERVADHLDRRVLVAPDSAYPRERRVVGDDPLDLLKRLFRQRRAGVRRATIKQKFASLDPAVVLQLQVKNTGAYVFQVFRVSHRPVAIEIPIFVELCLIHPDRHEMRRHGFAESLKR